MLRLFAVMRAIDMKSGEGKGWMEKTKNTMKRNWMHYLREALGLAIFMISASVFSVLFWGGDPSFHITISSLPLRNAVNGVLMGLTALFIFYSPFTAPSGAHINPAVTLTFLRLRKISVADACFYIIFQFLGGTLAVYSMVPLFSDYFTGLPVRYAVTVPGTYGITAAAITELIIAFIMMTMVLFFSSHARWSHYTRIMAAAMVCIYVFAAGPISGFGMNPARSFASAFPARVYSSFWIYLIMPVAGMLGAAEMFLWFQRKKMIHRNKLIIKEYLYFKSNKLRV